jgi:hypothetical protein
MKADKKFDTWVLRTFGSVDAYKSSLPVGRWIKGERGWYSAAR